MTTIKDENISNVILVRIVDVYFMFETFKDYAVVYNKYTDKILGKTNKKYIVGKEKDDLISIDLSEYVKNMK